MTVNNKNEYPDICFKILSDFKKNLPEYLTYHSYEHIIDVANVCDHYIETYRIDDPLAKLIRIAAVSHDFGYTVSPLNHEEQSITMIEPMLRPILTADEITKVNGMIRATKVPQQPQTFAEKILADADLDYLGRNDYDELSENLRQEFLQNGVINTDKEWLDLQISFLKNHKYHTLYAKWNRRKTKLKKLRELQEKLI